MLNIVLRTAIVYVVLFFAMRIMGQKQAGQLQPYEIVVTLLIAEVAATPMDDPGTPILYGLIPAITLLLLYSLFNFVCLKSKRMRLFLCGRPSILIHDGKLLSQEIRRIGYNLNDLMEQLRLAGQTDIESIHYAVLETNGQLSVLPYASQSPVTPRQMRLSVSDPSFYSAVLLDGRWNISGLSNLQTDPKKLSRFLKALGYHSPREILLLTLSDNGEIFLQDRRGQTYSAQLQKGYFHV